MNFHISKKQSGHLVFYTSLINLETFSFALVWWEEAELLLPDYFPITAQTQSALLFYTTAFLFIIRCRHSSYSFMESMTTRTREVIKCMSRPYVRVDYLPILWKSSGSCTSTFSLWNMWYSACSQMGGIWLNCRATEYASCKHREEFYPRFG